jgi:NAD-dependent deacetylase
MLETAARLLRAAQRVTVLTGAGISAESGIPTFREAMTGLWEQFDPAELATPEAFARHPDVVWRWYAERRARVLSAVPNPGHHALVEIERCVPAFSLFTQNVDGLHQAAGSVNVIELHGNIRRVRCSREQRVVTRWDDDPAAPAPPPCPHCGAPLRPDVVWFGELLPPDALHAAWRAADECDLFLSVGTSNVVEPAASLPWRALRAGADVVVVNPDMEGQRTGPRVHHLVGPAGQVLPALVSAAWSTQERGRSSGSGSVSSSGPSMPML